MNLTCQHFLTGTVLARNENVRIRLGYLFHQGTEVSHRCTGSPVHSRWLAIFLLLLAALRCLVAGIQQGTSLVADETLGAIVRNGVFGKEEVLSSNTNSLMGGAIVFILLGVVLGILGLRKPKAKAKEA